MRRIDFNKYLKPDVPVIGGGVISNDLSSMISHKEKMIEVIKSVEPGKTVHWCSDGAWSMHDLLIGLLGLTGPADVYISSYAMGETPARVIARLKNEGLIKMLYCVLDNRVDVRTAGSLQLIKGIADKYALIDTHAKVTLLLNDEFTVSVVGSANYTENERYEAGIITMDSTAFKLHQNWINHELNRDNG
jgi:hypothetical protein